ncbi:hypothetical protein OG233_11135 [Streptomyces sp. NBC_01218]|uniref:hypothetical protein n=1 Tax=unclassified Streptomyces TaxID=2593676 RepID=UPI0023B9E621|nr:MULTISPECIES: hypothetical protein [unclassified Streptomyces]WEH39997.1 hypothetical protein PZB77_10980 [Streptomyces sp. AM 2-1-1]WSQ51688.1 hypothetical protein OG233_11135 [Streptomyces sp. NBC_01218]
MRPAGVRRPLTGLALAAAAAALVTGCGIRSTTVPVDAGAAPSRVPCRTAGQGSGSQSAEELVRVYLVCASELVAVDRTLPDAERNLGRLGLARALLAQIRQSPLAVERRAGFTTGVPSDLTVGEAASDDPAGVLRLSAQPEDLSAEALAQVVCTFAEESALVTDGSVWLGGPSDYAPRGYLCTTETKARPQNVPTRSTPPAG